MYRMNGNPNVLSMSPVRNRVSSFSKESIDKERVCEEGLRFFEEYSEVEERIFEDGDNIV